MRGLAWILATWWSARNAAAGDAAVGDAAVGDAAVGDAAVGDTATDVDRDRGDVPGWVMVVVMTAALVTALMVVAVPQLRNVFTDAINSVTSGGGGGGGAGTPAGGGDG